MDTQIVKKDDSTVEMCNTESINLKKLVKDTLTEDETIYQQSPNDIAKEPSPKRVKLNMEETPMNESVSFAKPANIEKNDDDNNMEALEMEAIKVRIKGKEDLLEQLRKVELNEKKRSIEELTELTRRWKEVADVAFEDLFSKSSSEKESLTREELLEHLGIDPSRHTDFTCNDSQ